MKLVEVGNRVPPGFTVVQNEEGYYVPVRVTPNRAVEYLWDERTQETAKFWSLGMAILFLHEVAARRAQM